MAWITVPGLAGKVYQPDHHRRETKKHPCDACFACQWCDERRCQVCRCTPATASDGDPSPPCRTLDAPADKRGAS